MNSEMHLVVGGEVQGVGFRATTQYIAQELNLKGTVKNLPNGNVEIFAQGEQKDLEALLSRLKMRFHQFNIVILDYHKPLKSFNGFQIAF